MGDLRSQVNQLKTILNSKARCFNCGDVGHTKKSCPNFYCSFCHGKEHTNTKCKYFKNANSFSSSSSNQSKAKDFQKRDYKVSKLKDSQVEKVSFYQDEP